MDVELSPLHRRARIHAALGDPARLAIVDALSLGDASPGEIGHSLDLATNLVAHHLKVLQDAGLIVRRRSDGDRRRTYLQLRPDVLASLTPPPLRDLRRVVFVCTHNSARSQLAAALWADRAHTPVASAGTHPAARVHPRAVKVARRHGLAIKAGGTAHITDVVHADDLVIAVCDNAYEDLADTARPRLHWSVPAPADTDAAFEAAFTDLDGRVQRLAAAVEPGARVPALIDHRPHRPEQRSR